MDDGVLKDLPLDQIRYALEAGLVPLLHGDLVFDKSKGMGILSGDRIASLLGRELGNTRVLFGCDVDGVLSGNPKTERGAGVISEVNSQNFSEAERATSSPSRDATGGMGAKIGEALSLAKAGHECYIFNLKERHALGKILSGTVTIGTRFVPWTRRSSKQLHQKE